MIHGWSFKGCVTENLVKTPKVQKNQSVSVYKLRSKQEQEQKRKRQPTFHGLDTHGHAEGEASEDVPETSKDEGGSEVDLAGQGQGQHDGQEGSEISKRAAQLAEAEARAEGLESVLGVSLELFGKANGLLKVLSGEDARHLVRSLASDEVG